MSQETVVFEDFSGGDEGRQRPIKSVANKFRATNAWSFPSGGIGPRPPFQLLPVTGLPQAQMATFNVHRPSNNGLPTQFVWTFSNGDIYRATATALGATLIGTHSRAVVDGCSIGDDLYFVSNVGYGCTVSSGGVLSNVFAMPAGDLIEQFADRTIIANAGASNATTDGHIRVSAARDPLTWPSANAIPIGQEQLIMGMYVQRQTLVFAKFNGDIWVLRNVPTVNEQLIKEDVSGLHCLPRRAAGAVVGASNLWFCSDRDMVIFTGAMALTASQTQLGPRPDVPVTAGYSQNPWSNNVGVLAPLIEHNEFMLVGTVDQVADPLKRLVWAQAHRNQDAWTRHALPIGPFKVTYLTETSKDNSQAIRVGKQSVGGVMLLSTASDTSGNGGRAPRLYAFNSRQEYPHIPIGDVNTNNVGSVTLFDGDSSAPVVADFYTAEHWDPQGRSLTVTAVVVDYSYNPSITPLTTYNKFNVSVMALQQPGSATTQESTPTVFTPIAGSTPDGSPIVRGQERFQMGDQGSAVGFRVHLADWRGVVVHRITAYLDASEPQR